MSLADIKKLITDFGNAAKRAVQAGFEVIEIHGAHGYLINEFLSPLSNHRTDEFGENFENRIRLLQEIVTEVRKIIPGSMPLFVRISATDWVEGGWNISDSVKLVRVLKEMGVDVIDCSTGGNSPDQKIPVAPLYQVAFAEQIKSETGILTAAVGAITTSEEAEGILTHGRADIVLMARQYLRDPYFPMHAAKETGTDIEWPVQYQRAKK
jgi:2,4-dienoyl-CoA reductase-like NADH-dependent reductase (Old Yellow Enzyme family)